MRWTKYPLLGLGAFLLILAGFWAVPAHLRAGPFDGNWLPNFSLKNLFKKDPELKPPPHPEELTVPPASDARFSKPLAYPEGTLNQGMRKKKEKDLKELNGPGGAGAPGMGAGSGGGFGRGY